MASDVQFQWAVPDDAGALADFFVANASIEYISHGEIQLGRATALNSWSSSLREMIEAEIHSRIAKDLVVLIARIDGRMIAMSFLGESTGQPLYMTIEDMLVATQVRRSGVGNAMMREIEAYASSRGAAQLFLESGARNQAAHGFFQRHGFEVISVTMLKQIRLPPVS